MKIQLSLVDGEEKKERVAKPKDCGAAPKDCVAELMDCVAELMDCVAELVDCVVAPPDYVAVQRDCEAAGRALRSSGMVGWAIETMVEGWEAPAPDRERERMESRMTTKMKIRWVGERNQTSQRGAVQ